MTAYIDWKAKVLQGIWSAQVKENRSADFTDYAEGKMPGEEVAAIEPVKPELFVIKTARVRHSLFL